MNIELRNIQIQDRQSEETTAFTASLYVDGKKVGHAGNSGKGGPSNYHADDHKNWDVIRKAEAYSLAKTDGNVSLEDLIDSIIDDYWQERENKRFKDKMKRDMLTALLIGNDKQYRKITWPIGHGRNTWTIANLLAIEKGRQAIRTTIAEYKRLMSPAERILNTNIPEELL